jgi:hypothetical protein
MVRLQRFVGRQPGPARADGLQESGDIVYKDALYSGGAKWEMTD